MNTNSSHEHDPAEEALLVRLLAPLDETAAPFQQHIAEKVQRLGGELFTDSEPQKTSPPSQRPLPIRPRQRNMIAKALVALSALLGTATWFLSQDPARAEVTLGSVLDRTTAAKSLQLKITQAGQTADVWVKRPGQIRWEESPTQYRIATGSRLWKIDEETNTYQTGPSHWQNEADGHIDLLSLIGIEGPDAARFREVKPVGELSQNGKRLQVFRMTSTAGQKPVVIEAIAELATGELQTLAIWPTGKRQAAPLAELALVARDVRVDESLFVVAKSLSEDGRIGKLTDSQGIVTLQPASGQRWTPVCRQMLLKPGDWLRTDVRGANASTLAMTSQYQVTLGPGTLVELQTPHRVRLFGGEVQISGTESAEKPFELVGPKDKTVAIAKGKSGIYRINRDGELQELKQKPKWLAGYDGSAVNEALGSLVAKIDGRDVPLTVGYHKVKVEIRDQIARTTIEESFVNRTKTTLEGVFHFPLPQDASISGFGMWINGELIEADVVEKQRAREIYETILRERRDPGLLEWTGGNIFKARVYPIPALSEKRIKIEYTQVLPLRGNRYRYSYGLRSELLRKTPLRELSLDVTINSAIPMKSVECPTHAVRTQLAEHSARLEFTSQEYTPERDFEIVCEVDSRNTDVVLIPHRRGEDGYFLVQLTPPGAQGNWQREILPDGKPLELLVVCDTSASMDSQKRQQQSDFVASLLSALGPQDKVNLAVCDVDCHWLHEKAQAHDQAAIDKALQWLAGRISLGWTDLDRMTESVLKQTGQDTHVIYVGDGIVSAGNSSPEEFVNRLKRLTDKKRAGMFHAISVGNSFESLVLKGLARVGGGSLRQIGGEQTPQKIAFELLNEIAQPDIRDLKVEFRGLKVAAVYPETLPNLAAGTQQILIGRYLPEGKNQSGEIIISGQQGGETVRFASRVSFADAEAGNSFIPRLWARSHLDHLMAQGKNAFIKDQIIALSEEFHIITPYTSLLVLESDEDRERFGVKRRFQMRDGERFFAEGRDQSHMELLQKQMKLAGDWRLNLRRSILARFAQLGRNMQLFQQVEQSLRDWSLPGLAAGQPISGPMGSSSSESEYFFSGGMGGSGGFLGDLMRKDMKSIEGIISSPEGAERLKDNLGRDFEETDWEVDFHESSSGEFDAGPKKLELWDREVAAKESGFLQSRLSGIDWDGASNEMLFAEKESLGRLKLFEPGEEYARGPGFNFRSNRGYSRSYVNWIQQLFPEIPAPPAKPKPEKTKWQGEALEISKSLIQPLTLKTGGLEIVQKTESRDPVWDRVTNLSNSVDLHAPKRWLQFTEAGASQTHVGWCDEKERGLASRAFQLGRVRKSLPEDWELHQPGQRPYASSGLHVAYSDYQVQLEKPQADRAQLTMISPHQTDTEFVVTIDTARHVVLEFAYRQNGKMTSRTKYSDHVEVAGVWWPTKIESFDDKSRGTSLTTQSVKLLDDAGFATRFEKELPDKKVYRLLSLPMPTVREAEKAVAGGSAAFEDRLMLLVRSSLIQKWDDVFEQLKALEQFQPDQPGLPWIHVAVSISARRNEEARLLLEKLSGDILKDQSSEAFFLAGHVLEQTQQITDHNEFLRMLDRLRPVLDRQPSYVPSYHSWAYKRAQTLRSLGRTAEAMALQKELAAAAPWDVSAQTTYARDLVAAGEYEAAYAWLRQEINRKEERQEYETQQLRDTYVEFLRKQGRDADYLAFMEEWIGSNPTQYQTYQQYLSALMMANRTDDADATAKKWLEAGRVPGKLEPAPLARLNAAVYYALGQRYQISMDWIDPIWLAPLKETAIYFLDHEHHFEMASRILTDYRFRETDEGDQVIAEVARRLRTRPETVSLQVLPNYVAWTIDGTDLSQEDWRQIAESLRKRWDAEKDGDKWETLGNALVQIYSHRFAETEELPFRREQIARADKAQEPYRRASLRRDLFNTLINRDWTAEHEAEAFGLIDQLSYNPYLGSPNPTVSQRLCVQIHALHEFVDRMLAARYQADMKTLQEQGHPEKLTRTELAQKQADFHTAAREGVAKRLSDRLNAQPDAPMAPDEARDALLKWMRLERMFLDLKLGRDYDRVAKEAWDLLGDEPKQPETLESPLDEKQAEAARMRMFDAFAKQRAFAVVNYLAVRRSADPKLVERLKTYIGQGLKFAGDLAAPWRQAQFSLLVALDQPQELERQLAEWIRTDPFPAPWQLALGRLQAEQGKIKEAIQLFETVKRETPLSPADLTALGDWYLVADRKAEYKRAKIDVFKFMQEYQISNWLREQRRPWQQTDTPLPTELDERVLFAFQALFEKSNQPHSYLYELREFYTASRDFRLLEMLPDALTGRTPQQIYPFLANLKSNVLHEIRKEATADEILKRLEELRKTSQSAIDLRALDLLEALIERQSSEVLNQPGPHIQKAVRALQRAFEREWAEGEIRQMADFLDSLGTIKQEELNAERLRELRALHRLTEPGSDDRLFVAWHLSHALFYSHNQREEALDLMQIAVAEYQVTHPQGWPANANTPLYGDIEMLEVAKRFSEAEEILAAQIAKPLNPAQLHWLLDRQNQCYAKALRDDGQVSLGSLEPLYHNLYAHFIKQLDEIDDESHRSQTIYRLSEIFRTAKQKQYTYEKDLREFAFEKLPDLLKSQMNNYSSLINQTAYSLNDLLGPRDALEFVIARYEDYPKRYEYTWQSAWRQMGGMMAEYHHKLDQKAGELEPRLLAIILEELRRDLRTRHQEYRYFYHDDHNYFWAAKAGDFARVAEEVYKERSSSGRSVAYIADYLYHGLDRHARAIEILLAANDKKLLDISQQITLCDYLHQRKRHAESIPILQPIVKEVPDRMDYRTRLLIAYKHASRPEQMRELLAETDAHFRKEGRWTESNIAELAYACLEAELFADSVKYYGEAIPMHERSAPNRGVGQGTLSGYYSNQARAYSGLGETKKAVDAAAAGVVAWGPRHDQREQALHWLAVVLESAKDLDDYVKSLDREVQTEGQDSPLIRQKIGVVYAKRNEHKKAIAQFQIAVELQPADVETHKLLIASYDALGEQENAIQETLALLDIDQHNLELYKKLADRVAKDDALAERAATTIVEADPHEAENHQALAEVRQKQNRWSDAIAEWKQAAELRSLEPNGLLKLAEAQIHEKQFREAQESINKLNRTEWPDRFRNELNRVPQLQQQIPRQQ